MNIHHRGTENTENAQRLVKPAHTRNRAQLRLIYYVGQQKTMSYSNLIKEIVSTYQKHGWVLRRALVRPEARDEFLTAFDSPVGAVQVEEGSVDGLWFSRPSHGEREAWELRLVAENPFALFETFEKDETEEQREEMRREMEARLREYVNK